MRRLLILMTALAMVILAPATATATHDEHLEFELHTILELTGATDDGGQIYEGYHYLLAGGAVVDEGPAHGVVYGAPSGGYYTYVLTFEGGDGDVVVKGRGDITGAEPTDDGAILTAQDQFLIVEADGFSGKGGGTNTIVVSADGISAYLVHHVTVRPTA